MAMNSPNYSNGKVEFWETDTGAVTSSINDWSFVALSPTDPDVGVVRGSKGIQPLKRNSHVWNLVSGHGNTYFIAPGITVYRSDGKRITAQGAENRLYEYDPSSFYNSSRHTEVFAVRASSVAS